VVASPDPEIRRELPAGFDGLMLGARVRTNSFGMRGPELSREKPAGTFRIAVLGDSWAFGWGVGQGQEFPAVLEALLRQQALPGEPRYEVLNFAVSAYNTLQECAVLRSKVLRFQPDLVLVAYNLNDVEGLDPVPDAPTAERLLRRAERGLNRYSHLFRFVDDRLRRLAIRLEIERSGKVEHYRRLYAGDTEAWRRVQAALGDIRNLAATAGAGTYLVHCPWMSVLTPENPYRDLHRQVIEAAEEMGIPALDLFDAFAGRDAADLRLSALDGHPNPEGHRIAAAAVAADLRARGLLAAGPPEVAAGVD
jgi:lysophospholipase L1-like esterase